MIFFLTENFINVLKICTDIESPASPADPSDNTAVIIAGVVVSLVVIATVIGTILGYKYYKRKKDEKLSESKI